VAIRLRDARFSAIMTGRRSVFLVAVAGFLAASGALAADKGLPVPRFVTLRAEPVNVRAGPGERYPIEWVFKRKDLPVEVVAEFDIWRKIRDSEGTEGWVHQRMISGKRSLLVKGAVRALHRRPSEGADVVARAEPGVVAKLLECDPQWCRVEANGITGWLQRSEVWGVYPDEVVQ
jgi:SH3-like domain-containing protein